MRWYLAAFRKFADFEGRARRKEYWFFTLFNVIFLWFANFLDWFLDTDMLFGPMPFYLGLFSTLYALAMILPALAVTVRRLHDTDRRGWWILLAFIPWGITQLWLLVLCALDGHPGENRFGADPKLDPRLAAP